MTEAEVIFDAPETVEVAPKPNGSTAVAMRAEQQTAVAAPSSEADAMLGMLQTIIARPDVTPERVNQAFEFYQKVKQEKAREAFNAAMADARAEIPPILKNRVVDFTSSKGRTNYKHEDLAGIASVVDPILGKHGLSYRFRTTAELNEPVRVTCIVSHRLGYAEENTLPAPRDESGNKNSIQAIGSTISYLQRYTLKAALGLSSAHDDDGRRADMKEGDADPLATIDEKQQAEIRALLTETNSNVGIFLEVAKAETISDILAKDFNGLIAKLNMKKKQMAKGAAA